MGKLVDQPLIAAKELKHKSRGVLVECEGRASWFILKIEKGSYSQEYVVWLNIYVQNMYNLLLDVIYAGRTLYAFLRKPCFGQRSEEPFVDAAKE